MKHFFRRLFRWLMIRHYSSDRPTGVKSLSSISSVAVFRDIDGSAIDKEVSDFFSSIGVSVHFISREEPMLRTKEQMFLSLSSEDSIDERYAAATSDAEYKVGAHRIKRDVYDLVVTSPEGTILSQSEIFKEMVKVMKKIV